MISAAEASSDLHGAHLLAALKKKVGAQNLTAIGLGGPHLKQQGLDCRADSKELLAMGFGELIQRLPKIFEALHLLSRVAATEKPDLAILIDYPDFHFRLARKLKRLGIPVIYYIPPKVWAWRRGRVRFLKKTFSKILSILPFEKEFYEGENMDVEYVGNPLLDELPLRLTREEARHQLGILPEEIVLLVMPGSRPAELKWHLDLFFDVVVGVARKLNEIGVISSQRPLKVLIPSPLALSHQTLIERSQVILSDTAQKALIRFQFLEGQAPLAMKAADVGLIKSGTCTLEAAMMSCPQVIVYRASRVTEWIYRFAIRYHGPVGLPNLVFGWEPKRELLIKEFLAENATPENCIGEIIKLLMEPLYREEQKRGLEEIRQKMFGDFYSQGISPSQKAAEEILKVYLERYPDRIWSAGVQS